MYLKWSIEEVEFLKKVYGTMSTVEISKVLNRPVTSVQNKLKTVILNKNKQITSNIMSYAAIKFDKNEFFFENITEKSAYYAGLLAADGYITKTNNGIDITLHKQDKHILEEFAKDINYNGTIKFKRKKYVKLFLFSKKLVQDLYTIYNITNKKSLTLIAPNLIKPSQKLAFIKGYLDGDGCIYLTSGDNRLAIGFVGTQKMLEWIKNEFDILTPENNIANVVMAPTKSGNPLFRYIITGKRAEKIYNILFKLKTPYLIRKWKNNV